MTAAKQLQALKWVASTFGISIIVFIVWIVNAVNQIHENTDNIKTNSNKIVHIWEVYDNEGADYRTKVDKFEQKFEDMEDDELKKLFNKYSKHEKP